MVVAFIPARGGSERILGKNIRMLAGHPLIAYAIAGAKHSGIFDGIYVSTESKEISEVARKYGAEVIDRPVQFARADSPDIEWVRHAIHHRWPEGKQFIGMVTQDVVFMILRPTNPFRTAETIRRAWETWGVFRCDSMRAVERSHQHPGKAWSIQYFGGFGKLESVLIPSQKDHPWHDMPTQCLFSSWAQNGCIHIARAMTLNGGDYTGKIVRPFFTEGHEGLDLNTEDDWILAEALIERGLAKLEPIE
jgi:N-acylneuraminate cytidylyltransferase